MQARNTVISALVFAAAGLSCSHSPVDDVLTAPIVVPAPNGDLSDLSITVPQGRALAFVAQPMNGTETLKQDITLESADQSVAEAFSTTTMNHFVVTGVSLGSTTLSVHDESGSRSPVELTVEVVTP